MSLVRVVILVRVLIFIRAVILVRAFLVKIKIPENDEIPWDCVCSCVLFDLAKMFAKI